MLDISTLPTELQQLIWIKYHDNHVLQELKQRLSEFMVEYYGEQDAVCEIQYLYTEKINCPDFVGQCSVFQWRDEWKHGDCCPYSSVHHGRSWQDKAHW